VLLALCALGFVPSAHAWGCKGHETIALIAEQHLSAHARAMAIQILEAAPIDPALRRFCGNQALGPFADSSTWADDVRPARPETYDWHFIDIPLGAKNANLEQYCPPDGCVTKAILAQLAVLRDPRATPAQRGDALRFVIHFVGDLHQPLHATTNDDEGGNCVPLAYYGEAPQETNPQAESYRPNLHGIWDTDILERWSGGKTPEQVATELQMQFAAKFPGWLAGKTDVWAWAWESKEAAKSIVYGKLPVKIAIERPTPVKTCADDNHIANRMLALHETIGDSYQSAAALVVEQRLTLAGGHLAAILNSLWP
jgi:S1/P1 Nuclease